MGKYKIEVRYETGDSFSNSDTSDIIDVSWDDLNIAKENLKAIQDHYKLYKEVDDLSGWRNEKTHEEVFSEYKDNKWFVSELRPVHIKHNCVVTKEEYNKSPELYRMENDRHQAQCCMYIFGDNGEKVKQWNHWCGYFERLYGAEIIQEDSDLKFEL